MNILRYISYFVLVFIISSACSDMDQVIEWETKSVPANLIVEGKVTTDTGYHTIILTETDDYFANVPPRGISGAVVTVTGNGQSYNYTEVEDSAGYYVALQEYAGVAGEKYTLNIELAEPLDGVSDFSAETYINEGMRIDYLEATAIKNPWDFSKYDTASQDTSFIIILSAKGLEPPGIDNYYYVKYFRNDTVINDTVIMYERFTDFEYEVDGATEFEFYTFQPFQHNDTIDVEVYSVPEDYYDFLYATVLTASPQDPFGFMGPPANAIGNINDGSALGFFYGADVAYASAVVKRYKPEDYN